MWRKTQRGHGNTRNTTVRSRLSLLIIWIRIWVGIFFIILRNFPGPQSAPTWLSVEFTHRIIGFMTGFLTIEANLLFWAILCRMSFFSATVTGNGHSSVVNEGIEVTHFNSIARGFARNIYEDWSSAIPPIGHLTVAISRLHPWDLPSQNESLFQQISLYWLVTVREGESPYCQPGALRLSVSGMV